MGSIVKPLSLILPLAFSLCFSLLSSQAADPTPAPWPHQFHSILFMNNNGSLQVVDLWYDWTNGRNFNIIQNQLGKLLYDLEWDNGTSYIYTLDSNQECRVLLFPVGVLRPNWLEGATYLGQKEVDGFLCNVWQKVDFIWYYEDVITKRPVHWVFYTGMTAHVMTFEVGAVLEDPKWQAPVYCFKESEKENAVFKSVENPDLWKWLTGQEQPPETLSINPVFSAVRDKIMNNLSSHAAPETRAIPGQPWVRGWDDIKKSDGGPVAGNQ